MRLVSPKDELAGKLATVARVASAKSTIQILSHVLLRAEDGRCELASTDMELSLRVPLEATAEEPGAVVLPRLAGDIVRSMADGPVTLEHRTNEGIVQITGGGSSFSLNCLQAHDFPELPADEGSGLTLPAEPLTEAIDRVARAASRDETRPVLTGVLLRLGPDGMTMVATDSYRLAVRTTPLESPPADAREAIVPARALSEVSRLAGLAKAESVEVVLTESQALFRIGDVRLTSRIIEGQFPDYRQLVPDTFEHEVAFDRAELQGVLTRIGVLAQRNTPVRLAFDEGEVTISATSDQVGEGRESLPAGFSGERLEIGFNVEFLRAGVESVAGDEVRLGLISPLRPGLLRGSGDDYRYLLMPIRLNA
ncbi:MAG TPA: DNA polymerase III subunit beta [Miltoncostaeaceae bacterium]|nr:DNA polymerase III subunit beta [Miltoncostaeaceae bacterium]